MMKKEESKKNADSSGGEDEKKKHRRSSNIKKDVLDEDVEKMLKNIETLRREIERKLETVYEKSGVSYQELEDYVSNPNNFSEKQWKQIQANRDKFLEKVWKGLGEKEGASPSKARKKLPKKRKKMLGHRKGWMPMR